MSAKPAAAEQLGRLAGAGGAARFAGLRPLEVARWCRRYPLGAFGGVAILLIVLMSVFAGVISPYNPSKSFADAVFKGPSTHHLFGGDNVGRDVLSRVIFGSRVSLEVGILSVLFGTAGATVLGMVSGFAGGWLDIVLQRITDMFMAFPGIIMLLLLVSIFGPSLHNTILAIAIVLVFAPSRVIRSAVLVERSLPYVDAERSLGATEFRILTRHVLLNLVPIVIVMSSIAVGGAILIEASLGFLGLGVPPPAVSWGRMIGGDSRVYFLKAPWLAVFPGVALSLTIYAFNMLGDALRDHLDPRLRGR